MARQKPSKPWVKKMGKRLQMLRRKAGLSQTGLAGLSGTSVMSVRKWEQGKREPLFSTAVRIAAALKITLEELAGLPVGWPAAE
jgi:transcriptional regulator with XRE-family HTH domain